MVFSVFWLSFFNLFYLKVVIVLSILALPIWSVHWCDRMAYFYNLYVYTWCLWSLYPMMIHSSHVTSERCHCWGRHGCCAARCCAVLSMIPVVGLKMRLETHLPASAMRNDVIWRQQSEARTLYFPDWSQAPWCPQHMMCGRRGRVLSVSYWMNGLALDTNASWCVFC